MKASHMKQMHTQDLENTTGSWDMYGVDDPKRYPGMQEQFFRNVGAVWTLIDLQCGAKKT